MIIVLILMLALILGANYYLACRAYKGLAALFPSVKLWMVLLTFGILLLFMILAFSRSFLHLPSLLGNIISFIGFFWMAIFIYLLLFTLLSDGVALVLHLCKVSFTSSSLYRPILFGVSLFLSLVTVIGGAINAQVITNTSYEVRIEGKDDISDMNIVMISDLHLGALFSESRLQNVVDEINGRKPDLVCIVGDFFDTDFNSISDPEGAAEIIRQINSTYGVYVCLGNHDAGKTSGKMQDFLAECNITLLNEEYTVIDEKLVLIGRLDSSPIGGFGEDKRGELSDFFEKRNDNLPVIVLDHNPHNIGEYSDEVDLILSGHTHRGQIFPGSIITSLMYEVDYGYYRRDSDSPHVIVSSGVGYWGMPIRVGTACEVVNIKITP